MENHTMSWSLTEEVATTHGTFFRWIRNTIRKQWDYFRNFPIYILGGGIRNQNATSCSSGVPFSKCCTIMYKTCMDRIVFADCPTSWRTGLCSAGRCSPLKGQLQNPWLWLPGSTGSSFLLPLGESSCWRFKGLGAASENSFQNCALESKVKLDHPSSRKESLATIQQVDLFESCMMVQGVFFDWSSPEKF